MFASLKRHANIESARQAALDKIDTAAEAARHIDPAQEAVYQRKLAEANSLEGPTPLLDAEAKATGDSREAIAASVFVAREWWEQRALEVEALRIKAKRDVRQCDTSLAMHRVANSFVARV